MTDLKRIILRGLRDCKHHVLNLHLICFFTILASVCSVVFRCVPSSECNLRFVIEDGEMQFVGGPGPYGYKPEEVREWLVKRFETPHQ